MTAPNQQKRASSAHSKASVAAVLRQFGADYLAQLNQRNLSTAQAKAWRAIVACRTAALGGHALACDHCGHQRVLFHSCRNRHCPQCGMRARDRWLQARMAEVLPVPYAHLVFTLPHVLNRLYSAHPHWVIDTLFASVAATLTEFAANARWLGGMPAFTAVLHTWTQDLRLHVHLHVVIACGALDAHGQWQQPTRTPTFLFPVTALSTVFRGKFMAALLAARAQKALPRDLQSRNALDWQQRQRKLYQHNWVVYAKTPLGGPAEVLSYLSRYTHRTAISNDRLVRMDAEKVWLKVRAPGQSGHTGNGQTRAKKKPGKRIIKLAGAEFIRRFLLHVLPKGIKRVRHYGVLAPGRKRTTLARARLALKMPEPSPAAMECAQAFMQRVAQIDIAQCPCCAPGRMQIIAVMLGLKRLADPHQTIALAATARGPPSAPMGAR